MTTLGSGHIEQLPSGSFRVSVYAGKDPLTGRELRHRKTVKTEQQAFIILGRLLEEAQSGKRPDSRVTVANLLDQYMHVADLDLSTRLSYEGYIRRTILRALGPMDLRKVRGPVLDTFYARLRRCGNLACTGKPFVEHVSFPPLVVMPDRQPAWMQIAGTIRDSISSGVLAVGVQLPSAQKIADQFGIRLATVQHAMSALAGEGLIAVRRGRQAVVLGTDNVAPPRAKRPRADHACVRSGCRQHVCRPMSAATIRQIHAILSGAFKAAVRWEWIERSPASSAQLPKAKTRPPSSPEPEAVAKVIAVSRELGLNLLALYIWLAAVTGARRGELCGLQWNDLDLERGVVHIAHSYVVLPGVKTRKDTKTHQDRYLAIDEITDALLAERRQYAKAELSNVGQTLTQSAYIFSSDPLGAAPWDPNWVTKKVAAVAAAADTAVTIKALRHYSASQLLAGGIDLRNTAARLGHGGGGATTLRHYADIRQAVQYS